jgi:hypothetical protein
MAIEKEKTPKEETSISFHVFDKASECTSKDECKFKGTINAGSWSVQCKLCDLKMHDEGRDSPVKYCRNPDSKAILSPSDCFLWIIMSLVRYSICWSTLGINKMEFFVLLFWVRLSGVSYHGLAGLRALFRPTILLLPWSAKLHDKNAEGPSNCSILQQCITSDAAGIVLY